MANIGYTNGVNRMNNHEIHDYHNYTQFYQHAIDQGVLNETEKIHIDCGNYTDRRLIEEISTLQQTKRPRQSIPQKLLPVQPLKASALQCPLMM